MTFATPESVPSGMAVEVVEVQGHPPESLEDFDGESGFVLGDDAHHVIQGIGRITGDHVRFYEKDMANNAKDVRVWEVRREGETFVAEQTATF